jgi:hypothetical protein
VVAGWLGHSPTIAAQRYLQTRDAHFDLATGAGQSGALKAQNAAQHPHAPVRAGVRDQSETPCYSEYSNSRANECDQGQSESMGGTGLEPVTLSV